MSEPDFDALRAERNRKTLEAVAEIVKSVGGDATAHICSFDPEACYCACPDGPCEHTWDGKPWESADGCAWSSTCSRCGTTSMSHSMRTGP